MQKPYILIVVAVLCLSGCIFPGVYRLDVQQGNIVEAEQLESLEEGMTRQQVYFILGNPVTGHTFDDAIDTYIYTLQLGGGEIHRQIIELHYEDERLASIDAREILPPELANPGEAYKIRNQLDRNLLRWWDEEQEKLENRPI